MPIESRRLAKYSSKGLIPVRAAATDTTLTEYCVVPTVAFTALHVNRVREPTDEFDVATLARGLLPTMHVGSTMAPVISTTPPSPCATSTVSAHIAAKRQV